MAGVGLIVALVAYMRTCHARKHQQNVVPPQAKIIVVSAPAVISTPNSHNIVVIDNTQPAMGLPNQYAMDSGLEETTESALSSYAIEYSAEERPSTTNIPDQNPYNIPQQTSTMVPAPAIDPNVGYVF